MGYVVFSFCILPILSTLNWTPRPLLNIYQYNKDKNNENKLKSWPWLYSESKTNYLAGFNILWQVEIS